MKLDMKFSEATETAFDVDFGETQTATGISPHIGENGNWWIGDKDTGIPVSSATDVFWVTVTPNDDGWSYSSDKTFDEIVAAYAAKKLVYCYRADLGGVLPLAQIVDRIAIFAQFGIFNEEGDYGAVAAIIADIPGADGMQGTYVGGYELALKSDIPELPGELPNPYPLRFTGAVNATYYGDSPITVHIPEGGVPFETDATLTMKDGVLSVNTTDQMEQDNTLPITSAGVYATVGNIEALLKTI